MSYIKNLDSLKYDNLIRQEKQQAFLSLKMLKYIYLKHLKGKRIDAYEQYLNDTSSASFVNPSVSEKRIKTLIKDFDTKFAKEHNGLAYNELPCFSGLQGFNNTHADASDYYFDDKSEKRTFDLARYVNLVSNANGNLKNFTSLEAIPKSETDALSSAIIDFRNITDKCAERRGNGMGFSR